jgi:transposase
MPSPKLEPVVLSGAERRVLVRWSRGRTTAQALAVRSRIVLRCAAGGTIGQVAVELGVSRGMVSKWRSRFLARRLAGLADRPRPGRPRVITDDQVEQVIMKTLLDCPGRDARWSTRSMAAAVGMSQSAVSRIWRAFGLRPLAVRAWQLPSDPPWADNVRNVAGLHLSRTRNAVVLAVEEGRRQRLIERTGPVVPPTPVTPVRATRRDQGFLRLLTLIDAAVPDELDLHLLLDRAAAHQTPEVRRWLSRHPRFHLHFTPTSGSWLTIVERQVHPADQPTLGPTPAVPKPANGSPLCAAEPTTHGTRLPGRGTVRAHRW